jgi:hypothetical protein
MIFGGGLQCHNILTKFYKNQQTRSKVYKDTHRGLDLACLLSFRKGKENSLIVNPLQLIESASETANSF